MVINEFSESERVSLLQFWSGTWCETPTYRCDDTTVDREEAWSITIKDCFDVQELPSAVTCIRTLNCPPYTSIEEMTGKFRTAFEMGLEGFGII